MTEAQRADQVEQVQDDLPLLETMMADSGPLGPLSSRKLLGQL